MRRLTISRFNIRRVCFTALAAFGLMASPALADTYYVDEGSIGGSCDDARTAAQASSLATPWCSLTRAVGAAPSNSTVVVRAGDYPFLSVAGSRSRSASVTFSAFTGESVRVAGMSLSDSSYLAFDGLTWTSPAEVGINSDHIKLTNGTHTTVQSAIVLQEGASDVLIEGNNITASQGTCVFYSTSASQPAIVSTTVRGNVCENAGVGGVNARNFRDLLIEGNEIRGITRWDGVVHTNAIRTYAGGTGLVVRNNFIHDNLAQGLFIKDGKVTNAVVENNVIVGTQGSFTDVNIYDVDGLKMVNNTIWGKSTVFQGTATGVTLHNNILSNLATNANTVLSSANENYNLIANGTRLGPNDITGPPQFVDPSQLDYRLAPDSPAIDAATSDQTPTGDLTDLSRVDDPATPNTGGGLQPYYDIGAHEFAGSTAPTPTEPTPTEPTPTEPAPEPEPEPTASVYRTAVLGTEGLVSYWRLGESAGTVAADETGANAGALVSGPLLGAAGALAGDSDTAVRFDGVDDEVIAAGTQLALGSSGSLEGWFRVESGVALMRDETAKGGWILAFDSRGKLAYRLGGTTFKTDRASSTLSGDWHHVVATKSGSTTALYVDGELVHSGTGAKSTPAKLPWRVMHNGLYDEFTAGGADEVAIYDQALSATTIAEHYQAGNAR